MIENFKSALDKSEYVACISMDISKAFDCLPHCLTICKLFAYGLSRDACILIASYLFQRKQRVKIGNNKSDWEEINKGVPQGSILGPLIFNIFLNDIFYFVTKGNIYNYADDNSISVSHKELALLSRQLQTEAEVTFQWFLDNAMEANPTKFQGLLLKGNKPASDFRVSIRGQEIIFSKSITALGICIDENLTFDEHVNNICLKASRQISALQRLTNLLTCRVERLSIIASLSEISITVPSFGTSRDGKALTKCRKFRNGHSVSCSKIRPLIITLYYPNVALIPFEYLL